MTMAESGAEAAAAVLLCCARIPGDPGGAAHLSALIRAGISWETLLELGAAEGMLPLLHSGLYAACPDQVPVEVLAALRQRCLLIAAHNLHFVQELIGIQRLFAAERIPLLAVKGPVLAVRAYGDISLRRFNDLDLLVQERDRGRARNLLLRHGYHPARALPAKLREAEGRAIGQVMLVRGEVTVDLHWRLAPASFPLGPNPRGIWHRLQSIAIGSEPVTTLSVDDTLLHLCCHAVKHIDISIEDLAAIRGLLQRERGLDLGRVLREARRRHCERAVLLVLLLAHDLVGQPLPEALLGRARGNSAVQSLTRAAASQLRAGIIAEKPGTFERVRRTLPLFDRHRDRLRFGIAEITNPQDTDLAAWPLPLALYPLHTILRPLRLAGKYGGLAGRRAITAARSFRRD